MKRSLLPLLLLVWSHCWLQQFPGLGAQSTGSICQSMLPSPTLEMFVDRLPTPKTIQVSTGKPLTLGAFVIQQKLHRDLPPTTLYAFGETAETATYPGPTLEAVQDIAAHVRWENHIRNATHMFTIDPTVKWANPKTGGVPIVTHLHGAAVASASDGHPEAWFTASGEHGSAFTTQDYMYPNAQEPSMLWYHDHTMGVTRLNTLAGLSGLYIIRPLADPPAWIPSESQEVTLVIQDKAVFTDGSVNFPTVGLSIDNHPYWCPEYFGDVVLVNGKAWPYLVVTPRKYRFRMLNAANARVFALSLSNGATFVQIGSDGGLLEHPLYVTVLTVAPGERVDVVIDFETMAGQNVTLQNSGLVPFPDGDPIFTPPSTRSVMQFRVTQIDYAPSSSPPIPFNLRAQDPAANLTGALTRTLTMIERADANDFPTGSLLSNLTWTDPVTETPYLGDKEVWEFINLTPDAHPMHIHLVKFKVLNLQAFNLTLYEEGGCNRFEADYRGVGSCISTDPVAPEAYHAGWKDTVTALPGFVTRLLLQWTPESGYLDFPFDPTAAPGYLWHCHILDHEDNEMMRPIHVLRR